MATLIPHQFTMGSVFSQSMDILGKNFWKFSGAVLVAWVAFLVLIIPLTMLWFGIDALFQNLGTGADTATLDSVGALAIIAIVTVLSFPMASIAYGTVQQLRGQPFSFSQSMGWALRCLVPTGVATCLWSIAFTAFYGGLIAAGIALWDDAATSNSLVFVGALTVCAILGGMFLYARFLILIPAIGAGTDRGIAAQLPADGGLYGADMVSDIFAMAHFLRDRGRRTVHPPDRLHRGQRCLFSAQRNFGRRRVCRAAAHEGKLRHRGICRGV
jgi:hypothetical protein